MVDNKDNFYTGKNTNTQRLSYAQKNANDKKWYKTMADKLDQELDLNSTDSHGISEWKKMKVNYELFNNILNKEDLSYVCQPFGAEVGELPAKMVNRDICSGKIKVLLGMEMKRPFSWNVIATNPEATTRKEQEEFNRIQQWVTDKIMNPIKAQIIQQKMQETQGRELTPEEQQEIQKQIEQETQSQTPDEVRKYMQRKHQDPAEAMSQQLLQYLIQKQDLRRKFNNAFKHLTISAKEIMYVGIFNGEPQAWNINSMRFRYLKSPDIEFIEDAEAASCTYMMTPTEIVKYFGSELTDKQIDSLYDTNSSQNSDMFTAKVESWLADNSDTGKGFPLMDVANGTHQVKHFVWKALRKIGFLKYEDPEGKVQEIIVDETYKINKEQGDIDITWEYIPEVYETWKIRDDIYVRMRPVPGQFKDLDNLYECKLPYYGVVIDNTNAEETSLMDRLKPYQYYYNIIWHKLELLMNSDKGKKVLMNINAIPDSMGIDIKKWQYFMESTPYMWYNPTEEGSGYQDANTIAKVIDLSLVSDINKYVEIAEHIRQQAGRSVGITDQVEGQIGPSEEVGNTRQSLIQSSHILEWYFDTHNKFKRNVLQALLECAKIAYRNTDKKKISFFLDDMSQRILNVDIGLLDNSTLSVFATDSHKPEEVKETIRQLAHAAMQTGAVKLSDLITMLRQENLIEMQDTIKASEQAQAQAQQEAQAQQAQLQEQAEQKKREFEREKHKMEMERDTNKEEERRKTIIQQAALTGMSFNPDVDADNDGINDYLEIAKHGLNVDVQAKKAEVQDKKINLERDKFEYSKEIEAKKMALEKEKLKINKQKSNG